MKNYLTVLLVFSQFLLSCDKLNIGNNYSKSLVFDRLSQIQPLANGDFIVSGTVGEKYKLVGLNKNLKVVWEKDDYEWADLSFEGFDYYSVHLVKSYSSENGNSVNFFSSARGHYPSPRNFILILDDKGNEVEKIDFDIHSVEDVFKVTDGFWVLYRRNIIKLNNEFKMLWSKELFDRDGIYRTGGFVKNVKDGFAVYGSFEFEEDRKRPFIRKFDSNGNVDFTYDFECSNQYLYERSLDAKLLNNGNYLLTGSYGLNDRTESFVSYSTSNGEEIWGQKFRISSGINFQKIVSTDNNNFLLKPYALTSNGEILNENIVKFDAYGNVINQKKVEIYHDLIYSPLGYYIQVKKKSDNKYQFVKIQPDGLFEID